MSETYIYAMTSDAGLVKIGQSRVPHVRKLAVERECGVKVVSMVGRKGLHSDEYAMHRLCRDQRVSGEWFRNEGPVAMFIATCADIPEQKDSSPIRSWREASGLTLEKVAGMLGVTRAAVFQWETGKCRISVKSAWTLHDVTGIPLTDLRPDVFRPASLSGSAA